jgi:hypothetical protein
LEKKNDLAEFENRLASLEVALTERLIGISPNHFLGREVTTGVVQQIPFTRFATQSNIDQAIIDLIGGSPGALNTLIELAAALNNDANFAANIINQLATKAPLTNPIFTGFVTIGNLSSQKKRISGKTALGTTGTTSIAHGIITSSKIVSIIGAIFYDANSCLPFNSRQIGAGTFAYCDSLNFNLANDNVASWMLDKRFEAVIEYLN